MSISQLLKLPNVIDYDTINKLDQYEYIAGYKKYEGTPASKNIKCG